MSFTRAQVNAAKEALGLDPHLTHSVTLTPTHVHISAVAVTDGVPEVRDGRLGLTEEAHVIEESTDD